MGFLGEKSKHASRPAMGAVSFVTAILNTVALLLIARNMGPEILGTLGFLLSFLGLFFFIGDMGNGMAFENVLAKGHRFSECYRAYVYAKLKLIAAFIAVAAAMIALYVFLLAPATHTALHPVSMVMMLGYFITANLATIWIVGRNMKAGHSRINVFEFIESLAKAVLVAAVIYIIAISGDQYALFQLTFVYLLAGTLGLMIARNSARRLKMGPENEEIDVEFQDVAGKIAPFIAFSAVILNLDKIMLWYFSDFETLGVYFGAQRITIFIAASAVSIEILLGQALTRHIKENNTEAISKALRMTERYVSLIVLPVAGFYILFSEGLLNAFLGEEFIAGSMAVALLAGAGFFTAIASPHISYLVKAQRTKELAVASGLALAALCCTLLVLLPDLLLPEAGIHGMNGAAIAVLVSSAVFYSSTRYMTWKILECIPHIRMLAHIFSTGIMIASTQFVIWYFDINLNFGWLLVLAGLGTVVYVLSLYLSGEMVRKDYHEFLELTKPE